MYLKRMEPLPEKQAAMKAYKKGKFSKDCKWWKLKSWALMQNNGQRAINFDHKPMRAFTANEQELHELLTSGLYDFALDGKEKICAETTQKDENEEKIA